MRQEITYLCLQSQNCNPKGFTRDVKHSEENGQCEQASEYKLKRGNVR